MLADEVLDDERLAAEDEAGQARAEGGETSAMTSHMSIGIDAVAMRDFMTVYVKPDK